MNVLVTGASGFLGRALVQALLEAGHVVIATGLNNIPSGQHPNLRWSRSNLADPDLDWSRLLTGIDLVYHLAWSTVPSEAARDPIADVSVNVVGSLRLIRAICETSRPPRIVFASSGGTVYGVLSQIPASEDHPLQPISAYGISKRAVESYLDAIGRLVLFRAVSLRTGNLYGPGQRSSRAFGAVAHFIRQALACDPIRVFGDGSVTRDYVYIDDAVDAFLRAGHSAAGGAYNIGTGVGLSLSEVAHVIGANLGRKLAIEHAATRAFDVPVSILDATRAREVFGWTSRVPFQEGIARTLRDMAGIGPRE